jgi:hypothetical protein
MRRHLRVSEPAHALCNVDLIVGDEVGNRSDAVLDDQRISEIKKDPQPEDISGVRRYAAVAEIKAQEIDVLRREVREVMRRSSARLAPRFGQSLTVPRARPVSRAIALAPNPRSLRARTSSTAVGLCMTVGPTECGREDSNLHALSDNRS